MSRRFRPRPWPTLITLPAIAVMLGLGFWQVERLQWKTALLDRIEARLAAAPVADSQGLENAEALELRRAALSGRFLAEDAVLIQGRTLDGRYGGYVVAPFQPTDGPPILVNLGHMATDFDGHGPDPGRFDDIARVEGVLRLYPEPGWMQPENDPARDLWLWIDRAALAERFGLPGLAPLYLQATTPAARNVTPLPPPSTATIANNHLQYAITWFSLAGILAFVYVAYHLRRPNEEGSNP